MEQNIFLHFFFVPRLSCETSVEKRARGTVDQVKEFKVLKEYKSRSTFHAPGGVKAERGSTRVRSTRAQQMYETDDPFPPLALNWGPGIPRSIIDDSFSQQ